MEMLDGPLLERGDAEFEPAAAWYHGLLKAIGACQYARAQVRRVVPVRGGVHLPRRFKRVNETSWC